jgi:hypothetical protein
VRLTPHAHTDADIFPLAAKCSLGYGRRSHVVYFKETRPLRATRLFYEGRREVPAVDASPVYWFPAWQAQARVLRATWAIIA